MIQTRCKGGICCGALRKPAGSSEDKFCSFQFSEPLYGIRPTHWLMLIKISKAKTFADQKYHNSFNLGTSLQGIQRCRWLWSWSCPSFQTFFSGPPGGTRPPSTRLPFPFSPTSILRSILSPSKTLMEMVMATWQVWETFERLQTGGSWFDFQGCISGLSSALEYFPTLGVDALWITPIFASPMADFGYDISDYRFGLEICQMPSYLHSEWIS